MTWLLKGRPTAARPGAVVRPVTSSGTCQAPDCTRPTASAMSSGLTRTSSAPMAVAAIWPYPCGAPMVPE